MSLNHPPLTSHTNGVSDGFLGLRRLYLNHNPRVVSEHTGYGDLVVDPEGLLDLPQGFTYSVLSWSGERMDDGFHVPSRPDGMATFAGPGRTIRILRNHENEPAHEGPFGPNNHLLSTIDHSLVYDRGNGRSPGQGGVTTILYDCRQRRKLGEFLSLAGTWRNCSGGPTPWNSWISCEEITALAGPHGDAVAEVDHGFAFEVPAGGHGLVRPVPLVDLGRFNHEAVAVDSHTGIVYQTEDRSDGLLYRFRPRVSGKLLAGGQLEALCVLDRHGADLRNWEDTVLQAGESLAVRWVGLDQVHCPQADDLRYRGHQAGAAIFARGEGMWAGEDGIYFACTDGGRCRLGQIWRYRPDPLDSERGTLDLLLAATDPEILCNADTLAITPWGDLFVCEDRCEGQNRIVEISRHGRISPFGVTASGSEFAGLCFAPDGQTMFVNLLDRGVTLAIHGPFNQA